MTNILSKNNLVIFGYPRAGTKLIASILQSFGYHNYGEYFDTWTSEIIDGVVRRTSPHLQETNHKELSKLPGVSSYKHTIRTMNRFKSWIPIEPKWCVTVWNENFIAWPPLFASLSDCAWICPTRNPWEQYLSRLLVYYNQNPDGEIETQSITVAEEDARRHYWNMHKVLTMQNYLIEHHNAIEVKFDELINGTFRGFGQSYQINTIDQHTSLSRYILNIEKLKGWYNGLEELRQTTEADAFN